MAERQSGTEQHPVPTPPSQRPPLHPQGHPGPHGRRRRFCQGVLVALLATALALFLAHQGSGTQHATQAVLPAEDFRRVEVATPNRTPIVGLWADESEPRPPAPSPSRTPHPTPRPTPHPTPRATVAPVASHDFSDAILEARRYALEHLGSRQFACLDSLVQRESRWRVDATNRSSGAYGLPQALPGSKMAKYGDDWKTNPTTQLKFMIAYVHGRYDGACNALEHAYREGWY
jgi:hypothetical protein